MMRWRVLALAACALGLPNHAGAVITVQLDGDNHLKVVDARNASLLDADSASEGACTASQSVGGTPNCNSCTGVTTDWGLVPTNCCRPCAPSAMQMCSLELPPTWHTFTGGDGAARLTKAQWNNWVKNKCPVPNPTHSLGSKCDPCMTSGTTAQAGRAGNDKSLYCEEPDHNKDYITCFPATISTFQLKCAYDNIKNDAFGGWELQESNQQPNIPDCTAAQREWEVAFTGEQTHSEFVHLNTWVPDKLMSCGANGKKDTTGTDHCHDDYCTYEPDDDTDVHRLPHKDFTSCNNEITKLGGAKFACTSEEMTNGCQKSCKLCRAETRSSEAVTAQEVPSDGIDLFKTCNLFTLNEGNSVLLNLTADATTCESWNDDQTGTTNNVMCRRSFMTNAVSGERAICYRKKYPGEPDLKESCVQGEWFNCAIGQKAYGQAHDVTSTISDDDEDGDPPGAENPSTQVAGTPDALLQAATTPAAAVLGGATTTAAPALGSADQRQPYWQTRELARAAAQRSLSLLQEGGGRAYQGYRADTYFSCANTGVKDTNGTDFCHDDFCVYEADSQDPQRRPFHNFVSCAMEKKRGSCEAHGLERQMFNGCKKTCNFCNATFPDVVAEGSGVRDVPELPR